MSKFIFVRHGQSEANAVTAIAQDDTPLTELGIQQARETAEKVFPLGIKTIVSSPLVRARQTAETIAAELDVDKSHVKTIDELREKELGDFKGKLREHEPVYYFMLEDINGVESCANMIKRAQTALSKIIALAKDGPVLVVGHSVSGFYLLQVAKGKTKVEDLDTPNHMQNADFIEVNL